MSGWAQRDAERQEAEREAIEEMERDYSRMSAENHDFREALNRIAMLSQVADACHNSGIAENAHANGLKAASEEANRVLELHPNA